MIGKAIQWAAIAALAWGVVASVLYVLAPVVAAVLMCGPAVLGVWALWSAWHSYRGA